MNTFLCEDLRHLPPTTADPHMASEWCTQVCQERRGGKQHNCKQQLGTAVLIQARL